MADQERVNERERVQIRGRVADLELANGRSERHVESLKRQLMLAAAISGDELMVWQCRLTPG